MGLPLPPQSCYQILRLAQSQVNVFLVETAGMMKEVRLNKARVVKKPNNEPKKNI